MVLDKGIYFIFSWMISTLGTLWLAYYTSNPLYSALVIILVPLWIIAAYTRDSNLILRKWLNR